MPEADSPRAKISCLNVNQLFGWLYGMLNRDSSVVPLTPKADLPPDRVGSMSYTQGRPQATGTTSE
jgi:hypothetical protein